MPDAHSNAAAGRVLLAEVTSEPLSSSDLDARVRADAVGAVVTFAGTVRDHDAGRDVRALEYVGHPEAQRVLMAVAADAAKLQGVQALAVAHRLGPLAIGDDALVCAVAAAHRGEAFAACAWLVDEVKARLPVWKRQVFADGTHEWVNCA
ncbi:MAG: molybdenum cofactor biosynthesis protein MoaE [Actinomycetota bacterium]|jgi:molybdopterin synthase catalytic subunit